jgi:transcriptional regulator with XRE-family HTH domain
VLKVCVVENTYKQSAENLASAVKANRKRLGLSQEAFAYEAQIDRTYVSQIERGIANPSLSVIAKIADVFKMAIKDLL